MIALGLSVSYHELWGDELHSWNIAKGSLSVNDLIANSRYEGHPPVWYMLLFTLSKFTRDPLHMQYLHFFICALSAFVFLFKCHLNAFYKFAILFGYYFIYEYGALSRNYTIGVLLSFLICTTIQENSKQGYGLYYVLLFLLSNTHFLAFILACSFHIYFLWGMLQNKQEKKKRILHGILGAVILIPSVYFILPPTDSALGSSFWVNAWSWSQFSIALYAPLEALSPIPAWWEYHFWNSNALLYTQKTVRFLRFVSPFLSLGLIGLVIYFLKNHKGALIFFCCNLCFTLLFALVFPLNNARYVGFIFIGFVVALWLSKDLLELNNGRRWVLNGLLALQLCAAFIALHKDRQFPFSHVNNLTETRELIGTDNVITDYWCLNYLSAMWDKPVYCIGYNRKISFLFWDKEMNAITKSPNLYTQGTRLYFQKNKVNEVYLISNNSRSEIGRRDPEFFKIYSAELIKSYENAIERYSNIYLYKLTILPPSIN